MQYPFRTTRRQFLHVNLPANNTTDRIAEDLAQTLTLSISSGNPLDLVLAMQQYLASNYGGSPPDYRTERSSHTTFLIQLPYHLKPDVIVQLCTPWAAQKGMSLTTYRGLWRSFRHPIYLVKIRIIDYPMEFWEDSFFDTITEGFGVVKDVIDIDEDGNTRGPLSLRIECRDPMAIPEYLILDYWIKWKECKVEVDEWSIAHSPSNRTGEIIMHDRELELARSLRFRGDLHSTPFQQLQWAHQRYMRFFMHRSDGPTQRHDSQASDNDVRHVRRVGCTTTVHEPGAGTSLSNLQGPISLPARQQSSVHRDCTSLKRLTSFNEMETIGTDKCPTIFNVGTIPVQCYYSSGTKQSAISPTSYPTTENSSKVFIASRKLSPMMSIPDRLKPPYKETNNLKSTLSEAYPFHLNGCHPPQPGAKVPSLYIGRVAIPTIPDPPPTLPHRLLCNSPKPPCLSPLPAPPPYLPNH